MPEGQPLPRPGLLPRPDPAPAATCRTEGFGRVRTDQLGRRPRRHRRTAARGDRHPRRRGRAAVQRRRQPEPVVDDGHQRSVLRPHGCLEARPGDLRADRRPRHAHDERLRSRHGRARTRTLAADHPVGDEHQADQPTPLADDRDSPRARCAPRRHRPDPNADCRRDRRDTRRSVHPTAAGHRHRHDALDDARHHPRRPHQRRLDRRAHDRIRRTSRCRRRLDAPASSDRHRCRRRRHRTTGDRLRDRPASRDPHADRCRAPRERCDVLPHARLPAGAHRCVGRARRWNREERRLVQRCPRRRRRVHAPRPRACRRPQRTPHAEHEPSRRDPHVAARRRERRSGRARADQLELQPARHRAATRS